jgi:competence protein ComEC
VDAASEPGRLRQAVGQALALECERGTPFLLVPVTIAIGALIYFGLAEEPPWWPILAALGVCAAALVPTTPGRSAHHAVLAILLVVAGMALAKAETWRAGTQVIGSEISTRATGRVVAIDLLDKGRTRLTLDVEATARPTLR